MPEFPEVFTIYKQIKKLDIKYIDSIWFCDGVISLVKSDVNEISILGKRIYIHLNNNTYIEIKFGMTGALSLEAKGSKHLRALIHANDGITLFYNDIRRFGGVRVLHQIPVAKMPSPLEADYKSEVKERLVYRNEKVFSLLLNQEVALGVGSYIAQEALFMAEIHPARKKINNIEGEILTNYLIDIIKNSIDKGGASMRDYHDLNGNLGTYASFFKVYGRRGKNCILCNQKLSYIKINMRGCTFCSQCQL